MSAPASLPGDSLALQPIKSGDLMGDKEKDVTQHYEGDGPHAADGLSGSGEVPVSSWAGVSNRVVLRKFWRLYAAGFAVASSGL